MDGNFPETHWNVVECDFPFYTQSKTDASVILTLKKNKHPPERTHVCLRSLFVVSSLSLSVYASLAVSLLLLCLDAFTLEMRALCFTFQSSTVPLSMGQLAPDPSI
jgi:hypothetical protein